MDTSSKEFVLQVLGAHAVELASAKIRCAQLEQQVADLQPKPEPTYTKTTVPIEPELTEPMEGQCD